MTNFNPKTAQAIEDMLVEEGAVERLIAAAKAEAKGQFADDKSARFGAAKLLMNAAAALAVDLACTGNMQKRQLALLTLFPIFQKTAGAAVADAAKARKAEFDLDL